MATDKPGRQPWSEVKVAQSCPTLWPHGLYSPWNSPGQNTRVGSLSLLQGIFPTQGSNPGLLHCRWILYQLSHKESPRILEWVAYPFSSGSSWPRNWTAVSCIAGGFFTNWAMREAWGEPYQELNLSTSWSYTSNFQNCEKINFGHFYYPVYSIGLARSSFGFFHKMLQKPEQTFLANPIFVMAAQTNLYREQWFL